MPEGSSGEGFFGKFFKRKNAAPTPGTLPQPITEHSAKNAPVSQVDIAKIEAQVSEYPPDERSAQRFFTAIDATANEVAHGLSGEHGSVEELAFRIRDRLVREHVEKNPVSVDGKNYNYALRTDPGAGPDKSDRTTISIRALGTDQGNPSELASFSLYNLPKEITILDPHAARALTLNETAPKEAIEIFKSTLPEILRGPDARDRTGIENAIKTFVVSDLTAANAPVRVLPLDAKYIEEARTRLSASA